MREAMNCDPETGAPNFCAFCSGPLQDGRDTWNDIAHLKCRLKFVEGAKKLRQELHDEELKLREASRKSFDLDQVMDDLPNALLDKIEGAKPSPPATYIPTSTSKPEPLRKLSCYRVTLKPTNGARDTAVRNDSLEDSYVLVEDGQVFTLAHDAVEVAVEFPNALEIRRVGAGYDRE
jgi:hypothetical protein